MFRGELIFDTFKDSLIFVTRLRIPYGTMTLKLFINIKLHFYEDTNSFVSLKLVVNNNNNNNNTS